MPFKYWIYLSSPEQYDEKICENHALILPLDRLEGFTRVLSERSPFWVSLPLVVRDKDHERIKSFLLQAEEDPAISGLLCHNLESLQLIRESSFSGEVITGPGLYVWNRMAEAVTSDLAGHFVYPYELSKYECKEIGSDRGILIVYGRTPLMVTANCIRNSKGKCLHGTGPLFETIRDRKGSEIPVLYDCLSCYNVLYNPVVTSLHEYLLKDVSFTKDVMLVFTNESKSQVQKTVDFFTGHVKENPNPVFTKSFFNHGVE